MRHSAGALALLAGAGLLLWSRSNAATVYADGSTEIPVADVPPTSDPSVIMDDGSDGDSWDAPMPDLMTDADPVASLLFAIRSAEHNQLDVASGECYRTFYRGARFDDLSDHPVLTGECVGIKLAPATCIAAGIASGNCVSTAAGAYQFTVPTWREFGAGLTFSPEDQDTAARRLLDKIGATRRLESGDVAGAIGLASRRWASLPGSTAHQGGRTLAFVLEKFNEAQQA